MKQMPFSIREPALIRLFALAFLTLYLELSLIRFASAKVLYLGYFSNFVLVAVFLGIGLGFMAKAKQTRLFRFVPQLAVLLLAFILLCRIDVLGGEMYLGRIFFTSTHSDAQLPLWLSLPVLFGGTAVLFACIAQETAHSFSKFRPLTAYSIDIAGSLAGIVFFTVHSWSGGGPLAWFVVVFLLIFLLSMRFSLFNAASMGIGAVLLILASLPSGYSVWSPYQNVEIQEHDYGFQLSVNGISHQLMLRDTSELHDMYTFPYREIQQIRQGPPYENVLIIGAGSGTDVAIALSAGVSHVDAVEIDPEILRAGRLFNPFAPYESDRVTVHVTDGRAFMERTEQRYDLIIFALPDSVALASNLSSMRLESFLFTLESFQQARDLLRDDGVVVLYNAYRESWLADRLAAMLTEVFGHPPVIMTDRDPAGSFHAAMAVGNTVGGSAVPDAADIEPATDDWPFLYMFERFIPTTYLAMMGLFLVSALIGLLVIGRGSLGHIRSGGPFLLMGAAFLLLEAKSIVQFSLLFGATWVVNSLVFTAVLISVLLANTLVAKGWAKWNVLAFGLLFGSLALNYALPLDELLAIESTTLRYVVTSLVLFSPIFFANVVFGQLFKDTTESETMFGWNIMGTMLGGALEYTSLLVGYRNLALVVALLYALCAVWVFLNVRRAKGA